MSSSKINRRGFIKVSIAAAAAAAASKAAGLLRNQSTALGSPSSQRQWAMVIDQSRCNGCKQCVEACRASNDIPPEIAWNKVYPSGEVNGEDTFLSVPCMHCAHAPCVSVCPVGASYYRPDGIVMMDYDRCIGCRYCLVACPYQARAFNWTTFEGENPAVPSYGEPDVPRRPRGVVEKCTFCYQKIDRGLALGLTPGVDRAATPACVTACPRKARFFGNLNDPESPVSRALAKSHSYRLREDLGTGPRVYYLPADRNGKENGS